MNPPLKNTFYELNCAKSNKYLYLRRVRVLLNILKKPALLKQLINENVKKNSALM